MPPTSAAPAARQVFGGTKQHRQQHLHSWHLEGMHGAGVGSAEQVQRERAPCSSHSSLEQAVGLWCVEQLQHKCCSSSHSMPGSFSVGSESAGAHVNFNHLLYTDAGFPLHFVLK